MPRIQENWAIREENQLIAEQLAYDREELQQVVNQGLPTLNQEQCQIFDEVVQTVMENQGNAPSYFVHSAGGCGKTYLCNLIVLQVC